MTLTINEHITFPDQRHQWQRQTKLSAPLRMRKFTSAKFTMTYIALNVRYLAQIALKYASVSLFYLTKFFTLRIFLQAFGLDHDLFNLRQVLQILNNKSHPAYTPQRASWYFFVLRLPSSFFFLCFTEAMEKQSLRHELHTNAFLRKWKSIFDYTKWWCVVFYCWYIVKICQNMQLKINSL